MEVKRVCEKCGEVNEIGTRVLRADVVDEVGNGFIMLYYECKRCKTKNVVQIDNEETMGVWAVEKELIANTMRKRMKKQTVSPKADKRRKELDKKLASKRKMLNELCEGKTFYEKDGKVFVEHLTFQGKDDIIDSNM